MCTIVACKLPRDKKTGKPLKDAKWRLAKIRDRTYDPVYSLRRYNVSEVGASQLFLVDNDTDWTEGLSVHPDGSYLAMVNSALNNGSDKKDDGSKSSKAGKTQISSNGKNIRAALRSHDIEDAVQILKDGRFDGNTFITNGDRLFVLETYLPSEVKNEYAEEVHKTGKRYEQIVPNEKFITNMKEIKKDYLIVRTNSGVIDENGGYIEEDGDSYESAMNRRKHAIKIVESSVFEPLDLITQMSRMGRDAIDKNPFFRPLRKKGLAKSKDSSDVQIYSTSIIQLDPSGTMILKPLACKVDNMSINKLTSGKFLTNLVILPENSSMFESFRELLYSKGVI